LPIYGSEADKICHEVKRNAQTLLFSFYLEKNTSSLSKFSCGAFPTPKRRFYKNNCHTPDFSTDESSCEGISNSVSNVASNRGSNQNIPVLEERAESESESTSKLNLAFLDLIEVTDSHYSTILPVDKKSDLMNQVLAEFEKRFFGNKLASSFNLPLYQNYIRNLKAILTLMEANWLGIHHQQGDSLAGACLVMVCQRIGIPLKAMMKDLKPLSKNLFRKLSNIRKSRGYRMLESMINGVSRMSLEEMSN